MKTTISGNGVKVANRFAIVNKIEGKRTWYAESIKNIKASELLPVWNYKAEGLNLDQAKQELFNTIEARNKIHQSRVAQSWIPYLRSGKFQRIIEKKKYLVAEFNAKFATLEPVQNYSKYSYGSYQYKCRSFKMNDMIVDFKWSEKSDWNYYSKRYGKPKNTYSDRRVTFSKLDKLGKTEVVFTYPLTTFSGQFMEKAIAAYFKIAKVKCPKELKPIQLADYYSLVETNAINGYRLFQRYIGPVLWDYAILDTKTGTTFHANQQDQLVPGLRTKLQAKIDHETGIITKQTGYDLGFCSTGMHQFCEDNNLDFEGQYQRAELRNILVQRRKLNYNKYRRELSQIGITLGA